MRERLLKRDAPMLERVRWLFVLFNLLMAVMAPVEATYSIAPGGMRSVIMVASFVGFGVWAVLFYRAEGQGWALDVLPFLLLVVATLASGDFRFILGRWIVALFLHALYRPSRSRLIVLTAAHTLVGQLSALAIGQPPENPAAWVSGGLSILVMVYLMQSVASTLSRHQRLRDRSDALARITGRLLEQRGVVPLTRLAAEGALELVGTAALATVWRRRGSLLELVAAAGGPQPLSDRVDLEDLPLELLATPETAGVLRLDHEQLALLSPLYDQRLPWTSVLAVPVEVGPGVRDLLVLADEQELDEDLAEALKSYAHQYSLAVELSDREHLLDGIISNSPDAILVLDASGSVTFASAVLGAWTGREPQLLVGWSIGELLHWPESDRPIEVADLQGRVALARLAVPMAAAVAATSEVELTSKQMGDGSHVLNVRDVAERRRLEAEIAHRAYHDTVTGLPNRARFLDRLAQAASTGRDDGMISAVALLDLDDFKAVNDTLGHGAGDTFLVEVAHRLERAIRRGDLAARLGGDEFALLLDPVEDLDHATAVVERVLDELRQPVQLVGRESTVSASVGIAIVDSAEPDEVLRNADAAMYAAKEMGKNRSATFQPDMRDDMIFEQRVRLDLQAAIAEGQLEVHYQPIMDLSNGSAIGVEALVRWQHPTLGLLLPNRFIRVAEETGVIVPLGRWVLQEACREVAGWRVDPDAAPPTVSVNLSPKQIRDEDLVSDVVDALEGSGLQPAQLTLEITETVLLDDAPAAAVVLARLRGLGVRIAIDDFGTGYSSLSHLQHLPVDVLKIDREFVTAIEEGGDRAGLAHAIIQLASSLQLHTIAEGVEHEGQADALRGWGCTHAQGWLWSRACQAAEVRPALEADTQPRR